MREKRQLIPAAAFLLAVGKHASVYCCWVRGRLVRLEVGRFVSWFISVRVWFDGLCDTIVLGITWFGRPNYT